MTGGLIGVIDLKNGCAVHAIAGIRDQYRPVEATLVRTGDPISVTNRYRKLGIESLYIADLDAICGGIPHTDLIQQLATMFANVFVDAGKFTTSLCDAINVEPSIRWILPTESFSTIDEWAYASNQIGSQRVLMGLDLSGTQVRTRAVKPQSPSLIENVTPWIERARSQNVNSIVVLDIAHVGTSQGPASAKTCKQIANHWPDLTLISGGGVRDADDARTLLDAGCRQVLVATALLGDKVLGTDPK